MLLNPFSLSLSLLSVGLSKSSSDPVSCDVEDWTAETGGGWGALCNWTSTFIMLRCN